MKKTALRVSFNCQKCKTSVLKSVTKLEGINSIAVDGEKGTLTVIGDADPVLLVKQVKKTGKETKIVSVGRPTEPKNQIPTPDKKNFAPVPIFPPPCRDCQLLTIPYLPQESGYCSIL